MEYVYFDTRTSVFENVQNSILLNEYEYELYSARNAEELFILADRHKSAKVILNYGALSAQNFDLGAYVGRDIYAYAYTAQEIAEIAAAGVKCLGLIKNAEKLTQTLSMAELPVIAAERPRKPTAPIPTKKNSSSVPTPSSSRAPAQSAPPTASKEPESANNPFGNLSPEQLAAINAIIKGEAKITPEGVSVDASALASAEGEIMADAQGFAGDLLRSRAKDSLLASGLSAEAPVVEEDVDTKTISVYAAKGGVGKTSISVETAYCLALTNNGRRNFRVCILDYNIDFGDVASTLELDPAGNSMVSWAEEIQSRLDAGENPEKIVYSKRQLEMNCLQRVNDRLDLYVLMAPIAHEDSMGISAMALDVMIRNVIDNGKFDFVICDTGNNTRDASIIALTYSDSILLVATQDVTTANCNFAMLRTMDQISIRGKKFDKSKVKLVINNIIPTREAGISVAEVEETFPYECVARIERTPDIIKANNVGKPLVLNQKHKYSKQIFKIVRYLTAGTVEPEEAPKKKFSFFRK